MIFLATIPAALAVTWTWTGTGGNSFWNSANNWNLISVPTSASTTDLIFGGSNNTGTALVPLNQNIATPFQLNSLSFANGAGSFFLGGNAFAFTGSGNSISQNSSSAQSIANSFTASANAVAVLTLTGGGTGVVTLGGAINTGNGGRDYAITKSGTSTFILSAANTYGGVTSINGGVLNIQNATALGSTTSGTTVASGAALQIQGGIAVGNEGLTLNGSGITGTGAFRNVSGSNSYAGVITFGSASSIVSDSGTLTLSGNVNNGGFLFTESGAGNVTVTGVISGGGGLVKTGSGTLTLSGALSNTYTGTTTVNQGTLVLAKPGSVLAPAITIGGAGSNATVQLGASYQLYGAPTTINLLGQLNLNNFSEYVGSLTINGGSVVTGTGLLYLGGGINTAASGTSATMTGNVSLYTNQVFNIASGTTASGQDLIISGAIGEYIAGTTITKQGSGTLVLSGANTYTGMLTINSGVVNIQNATALGTTAGGVLVASGAALQLQGGVSVGNEALSLNGGGVSSDGALRNFSGNNSYAGPITLGSAATIFSDAAILTLSGGITNGGFTVTFGGSGDVTENGVVSGTGALVKNDAGTLTLSGVNTYSGGTTINGGTVIISSASSLGATSGTATINAATLDVTATFSTTRNFTLGNSSSNVAVGPSFTFTANGIFSGTGALNKTGAGTMILGGANSYTGATNVSAGTLRISGSDRIANASNLNISGGTFDLQSFNETIGAVTLASGAITGTTGMLTGTSYTLQSGTVSGILAGTGTVTKNTTGTVTLSGSNTFSGSTTISAGNLVVSSNNALGAAAGGTTVVNGAVLTLNGVNYTTAEPLTLNGSGISNGGALANTGTSTYAGPINAATNATINAGGGTLNLSGGLSKNGTTLTIAGGGTVNIATNGITGSAANSDLVIDGTTVVLSAASSYNGPTTIQNAGTLKLGNNNVLPGSPLTAMTVNTNSAFDLAGYNDRVGSLTGDNTSVVKNSAATTTSTLTVSPSTGASSTFAGVIAGTNGGTQGNVAVRKDDAGTLTLTGANTYTGSTTINGGTLIAAANSGGALGKTSAVAVNSGGTLRLGVSDQVNDAAPMTLAGGTFAKGNFSEGTSSAPGLGSLTLAAAGSQIDFGSGTVGILTFASFNPGTYTLTISNWTGTIGTAGSTSTDRLIFGSDQAGSLDRFNFSGFGPGAMEISLGGGYYEIVPIAPVPETSTWVAAALGLAPFAFRILRRRTTRKRD